MATGITLNEYLSNFSKNHEIDSTIKKWFVSNNGVQYCEKTIEEWNKIIESFYTQTEESLKSNPVIKESVKKDYPSKEFKKNKFEDEIIKEDEV